MCFLPGQHLYLYYEVYDPGHAATNRTQRQMAARDSAIHLLTNVAFFQGKNQAYETPLVSQATLNAQTARLPFFNSTYCLPSSSPDSIPAR